VSSASASVIQPQVGRRSCHARGSGRYSAPDPDCTPGALNPAVTQATIRHTICVSGYTETIRPSDSITEPEKVASMAAYGDSGATDDYEYDHLIPLELGGAVNDPRNLWPEPGASPNPKDSVENALHELVCAGDMPLARAQQIVAAGWIAWARRRDAGAESSGPVPRPAARTPPTSGGPRKPVSEVNCSDFSTHAAAQQWFQQHGGSPTDDVAGLDADHDGLACESLP
jgi:Excalibur calcium-binding domain